MPKANVNLDEPNALGGGEGAAAVTDFDTPIAFDQIKGNEPVERNEYFVECVAAEPKMSKSNQPKITWRLKILEGAYEGRNIFDDLSFSPGALPISKRRMVGAGLPADFQGSIRDICEELKGMQFYAVIDVEEGTEINPRTNQPYAPKNRVISTSTEPQFAGAVA